MKTQTQTPAIGPDTTMPPGMELALTASFGSVDLWRSAFVSAGQAHGGTTAGAGKGWLLLLLQAEDATLSIKWVPDLEKAQAGKDVLLSFNLDAATDKHWDAFPQSIVWAEVLSLYQKGIYRNSEVCSATHAQASQAMLLDVRREGAFKAATSQIAGAQWHNPATVAQWAADLPRDREVVVYCVYGHEVSRATAIRLRAAGINARYLQDGIDGWQAAGLATQPIGGPQTTVASPSTN